MQRAAGLCGSAVTPRNGYAGLLEEDCGFFDERLMSQALFHIGLRLPKRVSGVFRK